jgi:DNA segregation ATPase FtsK/SpoIIIE, S-DNA-T family
MTKKTKKKKRSSHPEMKGLLFLGLSCLLFTSLISFNYLRPTENYLGVIGYIIGFSSQYLFGLGSFLVVAYLAWISGQLLTKSKAPAFGWKTLSFALLLVSTCILLNVLAESYPQKALLVQEKIYTETVSLSKHIVRRYNLGGVPFYYLYKDLPYFNLQKLLSNFGVTLIFSFGAIAGFLLLTGVEILSVLRGALKALRILSRFSMETIDILKKRFAPKKPLKETIPQILKKQVPPQTPKPAPIVEEPEIEPSVRINTPKKEKKEPKAPKESLLNSLSDALVKSIESESSSFKIPASDLLTDAKQVDHPSLKKDLAKQSKVLEETLKSFGIEGKVVEINCGPTITSFEVQPPIGVKVQKIKALENDIALNMEAKSIRIIAPIPGKAVVGVEIPAIHPQEVSFKELLRHYQDKGKKLQIPIMLGKTVNGDYVLSDLVKMPHCLIAGATGSGKSVCINTIVMSILMNAKPDEVKLLMVDPKKVELTQYSNLPHMIAPVISEAHGAYAAMQWLVREMQLRYDILKLLGLRNITAFNTRKIRKDVEETFQVPIPEKMPLIVAIIDEFADLMMVSSSDLETPIARIAQMARAVGIHLILATQRPSREVITGIIKANFPTRIAFKVSSRINSQIILDEVGAESLLGNGDLLFLPPGSSTLVRAQGAYISDDDINKIVQKICEQAQPNYLIPSFDAMKRPDDAAEGDTSTRDSLYDQALQIVQASKNASTTYLQRKLKIGYARAASLIDELEQNGVIGPQEGSKPRRILQSGMPSFEEESQSF